MIWRDFFQSLYVIVGQRRDAGKSLQKIQGDAFRGKNAPGRSLDLKWFRRQVGLSRRSALPKFNPGSTRAKDFRRCHRPGNNGFFSRRQNTSVGATVVRYEHVVVDGPPHRYLRRSARSIGSPSLLIFVEPPPLPGRNVSAAVRSPQA